MENNDNLDQMENRQILNNASFFPDVNDIQIVSANSIILKFMEEVWPALTNKMVALKSESDKSFFDFSAFEAVSGKYLKLLSISSRRAMRQVSQGIFPKYLKNTIEVSEHTPLNRREGITANFLRKAILQKPLQDIPDIEIIDLKQINLKPEWLKKIIRPKIKEAIGIPIFIDQQILGMLWGFTYKYLSPEEVKELIQHLISLYTAISSILKQQIHSNDLDSSLTKTEIENADTRSKIETILCTRNKGQARRVRSMFGFSYHYNRKFRIDNSYIIPSANGYSITLKRYLPENSSNTKTIILMIPGFFNNRSLLAPLAKEMALKYGYIVFGLNVRGRCMRTLAPKEILGTGWTVDDYIQEDFPTALSWIHTQYPDRKIVVYGHSMGGMIPLFYTGSFNKIKELKKNTVLPDPNKIIAGIIPITSPNYINVSPDVKGAETIKKGIRLVAKNILVEKVLNILSSTVTHAVPTISSKDFFALMEKISNLMKSNSYTVNSKAVTINSFIGFKEITAPEWYLLTRKSFCSESIKTVNQFLKAGINGEGFFSYDGKINYTEEQKNIKIPLLSIIGTLDEIAPPETVKVASKIASSENNETLEYKQGHLGIVLHRQTMEQLAKDSHEWIRKLSS